MFKKSEIVTILNWVQDYISKHREVYLPMQVPVTGVVDYSWGDIVRCVGGYNGDMDVVRSYERVQELLMLRVFENEDLEVPIKNKLIEQFLPSLKVEGLGEVKGVEVGKNDELILEGYKERVLANANK